MSFGQRLRSARKSKGLTQKELATILGAKHNSISNWENDQNKPDPDTIEYICGSLDITPNYLLTGNNTMNSISTQSPRTTLHAKEYEALDDEGKDAVDYTTERERRRMGTVKPMGKLVELKISEQKASAGCGVYLYPDSFNTVYVRESALPRGVQFAVPVEGNSMQPRFHDGDIVLVGTDYAEENDIGIFAVNGEGYIKQLKEGYLHSLNPDYDDIPYDVDSIVPIGKVLGIFDPDDICEQ